MTVHNLHDLAVAYLVSVVVISMRYFWDMYMYIFSRHGVICNSNSNSNDYFFYSNSNSNSNRRLWI